VDDLDRTGSQRRIVSNASFTVAVPFAPDWPYEVHVRARRHGARRLSDLTADERRDLAAALREVVLRYDRFYAEPLPYLMTVMDAPAGEDGTPVDDWHLAVEFRPPNRGPDKLKMRASVETVAGFFINDTMPEVSAQELAAVDVGGTVDPDDFPDVEVVRD
jgi:UDPglucose--hexose-1-phosphate uridylyltransferase